VCVRIIFSIVFHDQSLPGMHHYRFLIVMMEIKNMQDRIKKEIIRKYSLMITSSMARKCGGDKRSVGEEVNISMIIEGYSDHRKVPKACEEFFSVERVEKGRKRQISRVEKAIKGRRYIKNRVILLDDERVRHS
jgi:hypothetical protein